MSGYTFRPAVREQVGLLIGLIGASGSGKTMSAMRLAKGICGDEPFAVIDTEARRALHYADMFKFDHCELHAPFRPMAYADAIKVADQANYKAIVVDSFSHEWSSEGGILDWQEEELQRMAGDNWQKREACKMAAWIKPKMAHKQMVQRLLQVKSTLILCFRAEEKVKMMKDEKNKTVIVPIGWQPVCSKEVPYELTVSLLLTPEEPGYPKPLKLQEQHKLLFPLDKPVNEESGKAIAEWASGGGAKATAQVLEEQRKQYLKSIQDSLVKVWPGKSAADTKAKVGMIARAFNGASWKDLEKMDVDALSIAADRFMRFAEEIEGGSFEQLTEEVAIQAWAKVVMTEEIVE